MVSSDGFDIGVVKIRYGVYGGGVSLVTSVSLTSSLLSGPVPQSGVGTRPSSHQWYG